MDQLRERVAQALLPLLRDIAMGQRYDTPGGALCYEGADTVLAALGLDDLDAAVERGAAATTNAEADGLVTFRDHARAVLEAALTPETP